MVSIKTNLLVEYSTIINLSDVIRDLMAEYGVHTSRITIQQVNRPEENIILTFQDQGYNIECNWTQARFIAQGPRSSYRDENGPLRFFFEILKKLHDLDGFGKFKKAELDLWDVVTESEDVPDDAGGFVEKYFSDQVRSRFSMPPVHDAKMNIVQALENGRRQLVCGPFIPETDISKHSLRVFRDRKDPDLESVRGMLVRTEAITTSVRPRHDLYISLRRQCHELRQLIQEL